METLENQLFGGIWILIEVCVDFEVSMVCTVSYADAYIEVDLVCSHFVYQHC